MGKRSKREKCNRLNAEYKGKVVVVSNVRNAESLVAMREVLLDFAAQFPNSIHSYYIGSIYRRNKYASSATTDSMPWFGGAGFLEDDYRGYY